MKIFMNRKIKLPSLKKIFGGLVAGLMFGGGISYVTDKLSDYAAITVTSEEKGHDPNSFSKPMVGYKSVEVNYGDDIYLRVHAKDSDGIKSAYAMIDGERIPLLINIQYNILKREKENFKGHGLISIQGDLNRIENPFAGMRINTREYGFITGFNTIDFIVENYDGEIMRDSANVYIRE
jgi:hypothetical protein